MCPLFGQILIMYLKCSRASFSPSPYKRKDELQARLAGGWWRYILGGLWRVDIFYWWVGVNGVGIGIFLMVSGGWSLVLV